MHVNDLKGVDYFHLIINPKRKLYSCLNEMTSQEMVEMYQKGSPDLLFSMFDYWESVN